MLAERYGRQKNSMTFYCRHREESSEVVELISMLLCVSSNGKIFAREMINHGEELLLDNGMECGRKCGTSDAKIVLDGSVRKLCNVKNKSGLLCCLLRLNFRINFEGKLDKFLKGL